VVSFSELFISNQIHATLQAMDSTITPEKPKGRKPIRSEAVSRAAYILYYINDFSQADLAEAMNRPATTLVRLANEHKLKLEGA
jgi:hypothetical protein